MATFIPIHGPEKEIGPKNGTGFKLEELYALVGDPIEQVWLTDNKYMIINEEGKLKGFQVNERATELFQQETENYSDWIVGHALVVSSDEEGELT